VSSSCESAKRRMRLLRPRVARTMVHGASSASPVSIYARVAPTQSGALWWRCRAALPGGDGCRRSPAPRRGGLRLPRRRGQLADVTDGAVSVDGRRHIHRNERKCILGRVPPRARGSRGARAAPRWASGKRALTFKIALVSLQTASSSFFTLLGVEFETHAASPRLVGGFAFDLVRSLTPVQ